MTGHVAALVLALLACGACHAQVIDVARSRIDFDVQSWGLAGSAMPVAAVLDFPKKGQDRDGED